MYFPYQSNIFWLFEVKTLVWRCFLTRSPKQFIFYHGCVTVVSGRQAGSLQFLMLRRVITGVRVSHAFALTTAPQ